jgi:hypothetical protein
MTGEGYEAATGSARTTTTRASHVKFFIVVVVVVFVFAVAVAVVIAADVDATASVATSVAVAFAVSQKPVMVRLKIISAVDDLLPTWFFSFSTSWYCKVEYDVLYVQQSISWYDMYV